MRRINGKITKEYRAWKAMKSRCYSPSTRGTNYDKIKVCDEWINSFDKFYIDMGLCPEKFSLDRIDNNGDYCKENCRWSDSVTQNSNRGGFNKVFTLGIESKVLKHWAKDLNINYNTLWTRIFRDGIKFEDAIKNDPYYKLIDYNGEVMTLTDWCEKLNLPRQTIIDRKHRGWSPKKYFETPIKKIKI